MIVHPHTQNILNSFRILVTLTSKRVKCHTSRRCTLVDDLAILLFLISQESIMFKKKSTQIEVYRLSCKDTQIKLMIIFKV